MYACYLTVYCGDQLPPFYIGSTTIQNLERGYRGSVVSKKYKKVFNEELKNKPHLFDYVVLNEFETRDSATENELYYQKLWNVVKSDLFFNEAFASVGGMFGRDVKGFNNPMYGRTHSKETKKKLSAQKRGKTRIVSEETKQKQIGRLCVKDKVGNMFRVSVDDPRYLSGELVPNSTGRKLSEAQKKRLSEVNSGKLMSKDAKRKISEAKKGTIVTEGTKKKISEATKGKLKSEEMKKNLSKARKGKSRGKFSEEWKQNISKSLKGRKRSEEAVRKMVETKKGQKAKVITCPYCGKSGGNSNMKRYHFEHCKTKI